MNTEFPYNKMQALKLKRFCRPWYLGLIIAFGFAGSMLFTPHTYAATLDFGGTGAGTGTIILTGGEHNFPYSAGVGDQIYVGSLLTQTGITISSLNVLIQTPCTPSCTSGTISTVIFQGDTMTGAVKLGHSAEINNNQHAGPRPAYSSFSYAGTGIVLHPGVQYWVGVYQIGGGASITAAGQTGAPQLYLKHAGGVGAAAVKQGSASLSFQVVGTPNGEVTGALLFSRVGGAGSVYTNTAVSFSGSLVTRNYNYNHVYFWNSVDAYPNEFDGNGHSLVTTLVDSGSIAEPYTFTHTFTTAGGYSPLLLYADCDLDAYTTAGSGCHSKIGVLNVANFNATTITAISPLANSLKNKFTTPLATVNVGDSVPFSYHLDSNICHYGDLTDKGTVSAAYFYSGESQNIMSGSGVTNHANFNYTYVQPGFDSSGVAQPYIAVVCTADVDAWTNFKQQSFNVYLGGSMRAAQAQSINVNESASANVPILQNANYVNGGESAGFSTGTGHNFSFFADRFTAAQGEVINMRIKYFVPYTVASVILHTDTVDDVANPPTIGTGSSKGKDIYVPIRYSSPGVVHPWIEVRSTTFNSGNPNTYDIFYLGGTTNISLAQGIIITNQVITTSNNFLDPDGIFALDPSAFVVSFGNNSNILLQWAGDLVTVIVQAALIIASQAWHLIKISPIFSFFDQSLHPVAGSVHTLPSKIFNQPQPFTPADRIFTIAYANESDSAAMIWFTNLFVAGELMMFSVKALFPHPHHVRSNK